MDCSLPGSSVHGIFQAWILEWVAISFSSRSSQPRDQTQVFHTVGRRFIVWATRELKCLIYLFSIIHFLNEFIQVHITFKHTIFIPPWKNWNTSLFPKTKLERTPTLLGGFCGAGPAVLNSRTYVRSHWTLRTAVKFSLFLTSKRAQDKATKANSYHIWAPRNNEISPCGSASINQQNSVLIYFLPFL